MKCPLIVAGSKTMAVTPKDKSNDCLQEECAWWVNEYNRCAMNEAAISLGALAEHLSVIRDYGPGGEPK